ncbi:MAG TPA: T9SS type A sorting domain-containing protein, partial [Saprospiraceae bacterium]|nr:T9SS type A sorting domain-containing protein [Saprospiraceae bacterium]
SNKLSIRSTGNDAQITTGLRIYQNVPNPFTTETEISFEIDKEESVSLNVFNAEGKLLYSKTANFAKGLNSFKITEDDLKTKGILLYQILTKTHYSGRRMIKLF